MNRRRGAPLLALLVLLLLSACKVELFSGLGEHEANDMMAALLRRGIPAEKAPGLEGTYVLMVEEARFAEAVELLKMQGFPREPFASIGEVFKKEGLISSPLEERVRFVYALSQELSATLSEIDGVLSARVHVVLPDNALSTGKIVPSSAAVFIRHLAENSVDELVPQIKMLVTNSIEGLAYDKVSVVLFPVVVPPELDRPADLAEIGPLKLDRESTGTFWMIVGGLGFLALLGLGGTGAMAFLWMKARKGAAGGAPARGGSALPAPAE
jgi:type III secretion protein J